MDDKNFKRLLREALEIKEKKTLLKEWENPTLSISKIQEAVEAQEDLIYYYNETIETLTRDEVDKWALDMSKDILETVINVFKGGGSTYTVTTIYDNFRDLLYYKKFIDKEFHKFANRVAEFDFDNDTAVPRDKVKQVIDKYARSLKIYERNLPLNKRYVEKAKTFVDSDGMLMPKISEALTNSIFYGEYSSLLAIDKYKDLDEYYLIEYDMK